MTKRKTNRLARKIAWQAVGKYHEKLNQPAGRSRYSDRHQHERKPIDSQILSRIILSKAK